MKYDLEYFKKLLEVMLSDDARIELTDKGKESIWQEHSKIDWYLHSITVDNKVTIMSSSHIFIKNISVEFIKIPEK